MSSQRGRYAEHPTPRIVGYPDVMAKVPVNALTAEVRTSRNLTDFPTYQDLANQRVIQQIH